MYFEKILKLFRRHSKLVLVGVLALLFPVLLIWTTQSFFDVASSSIDDAHSDRIEVIHLSVVNAIKYTDADTVALNTLLERYSSRNPDILKMRVVLKESENFRIIASIDPTQVGKIDLPEQQYSNLLVQETQSLVEKKATDQHRIWQSYSKVAVGGTHYFIFSEHSLTVIDAVMAQRLQQAYYSLTVVFLFLITLAFWLNRQIYWHKKHDALQQVLKKRSIFSNLLAHEFRTPLTAIKGYSSFLEESKTITQKEKEYAANIHLSAERLITYVYSFSEVTRLQTGEVKVERKTANVNDFLKKVVKDSLVSYKKRDIDIVLDEPKDIILLETDVSRMSQVINNLLSSIARQSKSTKISISCVETRSQVELRIKGTNTKTTQDSNASTKSNESEIGNIETDFKPLDIDMWATNEIVTMLGGSTDICTFKANKALVLITFEKNS